MDDLGVPPFKETPIWAFFLVLSHIELDKVTRVFFCKSLKFILYLTLADSMFLKVDMEPETLILMEFRR